MKEPSIIDSEIQFLDNEIAHLHSIFSTYKRLYQGDDNTCDILEDSDVAFFNDLYIVYLNYIAVAVSRLLDPDETNGNSNLTLFTLISILDDAGYAEAKHFEVQLKDIKLRAYNFTEPRNQLVAHFDHDMNMGDPGSKAIPSFTTKEFDDFYCDIGSLMNDIRAVLSMPHREYKCGIVGHGAGGRLMQRLETAKEYITNK